jgi:hypothetical protein
MDIVLGTLELGAIGGAAAYLLTAAEQLERLAHEATIYAAAASGARRSAPGSEKRSTRSSIPGEPPLGLEPRTPSLPWKCSTD